MKFTVLDSADPTHRAFVGDNFNTYATDIDTVGSIVYFDDDAKGIKVRGLDRQLWDCDYRNCNPSWESVFLCGKCLVYVWKQRNIASEVHIDGWLLGTDDRLEKKFRIVLDVDLGHHHSYKDGNITVEHGRWLCLPTNATTTTCIDLTSIREGSSEKSGNILIDRVFLPVSETPCGAIRNDPFIIENPVYRYENDITTMRTILRSDPARRATLETALQQTNKPTPSRTTTPRRETAIP